MNRLYNIAVILMLILISALAARTAFMEKEDAAPNDEILLKLEDMDRKIDSIYLDADTTAKLIYF